eukprot:COSAG01_NODE_3892_length_5578_cov_5.863296_4_plen_178_part_00
MMETSGQGGGEAEPRSFWSANRIMDVAMDRDHTVLAVCLSVGGGASGTDGEEAEPAAAAASVPGALGAGGASRWPSWAQPGAHGRGGLVAAVVWAVPSGIPLAVVDLRATLAEAFGGPGALSDEGVPQPPCCSAVQALLHPTQPLLVLGCESEAQGVEAHYPSSRTYRTLLVDWAGP